MPATLLDVITNKGYRLPVSPPDGFYFGPFRFQGTLDYDAAADTEVDLAASAAIVDARLNQQLRVEANPSWILHIEAVKVELLDEAALEHTDPEDLIKVFNGTTLRVKQGGDEDRYELREAMGFPFGAGTVSTGTAATFERWNRPAQWMRLPNAIEIDLESANKFAIGFSSAATGTLLAADSLFDVLFDGFVVAKGSPAFDLMDWRKSAGTCGTVGYSDLAIAQETGAELMARGIDPRVMDSRIGKRTGKITVK